MVKKKRPVAVFQIIIRETGQTRSQDLDYKEKFLLRQNDPIIFYISCDHV